jgi:hypothetical protein
MATGHGTKHLIYLEIRGSSREKLSRWGHTHSKSCTSSMTIIATVLSRSFRSLDSIQGSRRQESPLIVYDHHTLIADSLAARLNQIEEIIMGRQQLEGKRKKIKRKGTRTNTYCCIETLVGRLTMMQKSFKTFIHITSPQFKPLLRALSQDPKLLA